MSRMIKDSGDGFITIEEYDDGANNIIIKNEVNKNTKRQAMNEDTKKEEPYDENKRKELLEKIALAKEIVRQNFIQDSEYDNIVCDLDRLYQNASQRQYCSTLDLINLIKLASNEYNPDEHLGKLIIPSLEIIKQLYKEDKITSEEQTLLRDALTTVICQLDFYENAAKKLYNVNLQIIQNHN